MVWDWLIIGSGFGGSVSALRLAEKGYSVLVLEKGGRWQEEDFPRTNWNLKKWFWVPAVGFRGFFKMTFLRHVTVLSGVGVGGGSLVYANTLPTPGESFFTGGDWGGLADWRSELEPHYETARRMLGAVENPLDTAPDRALFAVAERMGREDHFRPAPVGVFFGEPGVTVPDPYHLGAGPHRTGCTFCGGCLTGCRYGAKNTLDRNYLWLAERRGVTVQPDTEVTWVHPLSADDPESKEADGGRYVVTAREGPGPFRTVQRSHRARNVIFAGGVLGTVELLLRLRRSPRGLPELSARVGDRVRTNSEVLVGVTTQRRDLDLSEGVAITTIFRTDDRSYVEPVRFSNGSGFFRLLATPHAPGRTLFRRLANAAARVARAPVRSARALLVPDWARYTTALLYMRTQEGYLRLTSGHGLFSWLRPGLKSRDGDGPAPTAAIHEATELAESFAKEVDGFVGSLLTETLLGIPTTAHILGGACMGRSSEDGVIDHRHRVFGYDGLWVIDGSAMSANPGVNPSLTITALAERAMSFIPPSGDAE
jgi:cholesterol oxidase